MGSAMFELDTVRELPLWAQVLMASRMARRAVLAMPATVSESTRTVLLAGCDAMDRCAAAGEWSKGERAAVKKAMDHQPAGDAQGAKEAVYYAADATHAAHDSLDFSAAESACVGSVQRAMSAAAGAKGLQKLQVLVFMASDLDSVRFACKECGVGRYDGVGAGVMGRLAPVHRD
jgi:hypothetical protein